MIIINLLLLSLFLSLESSILAQPTSHITILGSVYCDLCYDNTFSKHSYFLPGVDVNIECKLKASSARTTEQISFSVNRTTDMYGMYRLEIPSVDGIDCTEDPTVQSFCRATLVRGSAPACRIPATRSSSDEITVKSKQTNSCTYALGALSFRPAQRNVTLCRNHVFNIDTSWNDSKTFWPFFPPYVLPWPNFPQLPPWPDLPPLPQLPPLPSLPFPPATPNPPSLPFPFPPAPPIFTPTPPLPPPPPGFNFWDPRTWIPQLPPSPPADPRDKSLNVSTSP